MVMYIYSVLSFNWLISTCMW